MLGEAEVVVGREINELVIIDDNLGRGRRRNLAQRTKEAFFFER